MTSNLIPRRLARLAARCLVALLLFAQGVMLAHACSPAERAAAHAIGMAATAPCHEPDRAVHGARVADERASCLSHCSTADQSANTPQVWIPAMPVAAVLSLPAAPDALVAGRDGAAPPATGDPPAAIRFQVFRS